MAETRCSWLTVYAMQIKSNKEQYTQMLSRIIVLYLLQVLGFNGLEKQSYAFCTFHNSFWVKY